MTITLEPIGHVVGGRTEPRDDGWAAEQAVIELDADQFTSDALAGLNDFSHWSSFTTSTGSIPLASRRRPGVPATTPPGPASASSPSEARTVRIGWVYRPARSSPWRVCA